MHSQAKAAIKRCRQAPDYYCMPEALQQLFFNLDSVFVSFPCNVGQRSASWNGLSCDAAAAKVLLDFIQLFEGLHLKVWSCVDWGFSIVSEMETFADRQVSSRALYCRARGCRC